MAYQNFTQWLADGHFANTDPMVIGGPWPGKHVVITDISVAFFNGPVSYIYVGGTETQPIFTIDPSAYPSKAFFWHGKQALWDGETLTAGTDSAGNIRIRVTGWLFDL